MRSPLLLLLCVACSPISRGSKEHRPDGAIPVTRGVGAEVSVNEAIDALALHALKKNGVGLGIAVIKQGEVVYSSGYGWANLKEGRELTADTPMQVGSVSKTFIAVAAMQAVERGVLELDDPITDLVGFPVENPKAEGVIRLRHLLTHTSGMRDSAEYERSYADGDPTVSLLDFERGYVTEGGAFHRRGNFSKHPPGSFAYSNVGAALGALGIAQIQGVEFADLVKRDILDPLGMEHTAFFHRDLPVPAATNYSSSYRAWAPYGFPTYPDGLLKTSPNDLARYLAAIEAQGTLDGVQVLSAASVDEMLTVDHSIGTDEAGQAISWAQLGFVPERELMGHTGGDPGVGCLMAMDREAHVGVVLTVNQLRPDDLGETFAELFKIAEDL